MKTKYRDLEGQRFGKLIVLTRVGTTKASRPLWLCKCDCGNTTVVQSTNLISGNTTSCGCNKRIGIETHGKSNSDFYRVWQSIKTRCTNKNSNRYKYYGGKGIRYDPRWEVFEHFFEDMHGGYRKGLTLDRVDHDKDYCKENCRWVDYTVQNNNKADNIYLVYNGTKYTVQEAAEKFGLSISVIYNRRRRDWSDIRIIETPIDTTRINRKL